MPSPFPGMDPFIESQKWEGFHTRFITGICDTLVSIVRPRYDVDVEKRVYLERRDLESSARSFVADVGVIDVERGWAGAEGGVAMGTAVEPKACTLPWPEEHREAYLVIRRPRVREVVTVIELLSPTNKLRRADGRELYLEKRMELSQTRSHFVELDLLRGGERMPFSDPPDGDYFALVSRAGRRPVAEVYGWPLAHRLPAIPIPLAKGDPDVSLDLQFVFDTVYDRAGYDYSIDYGMDISPSLSKSEKQWVAGILSNDVKRPT